MEKDLLIRGLAELGIPAPDAYVPAFAEYLDALIRWNRAYNLTSLRSESDIITKHFIDSLLYLTFIPPSRTEAAYTADVCDIGSGAGFPGVPLAIVRPDLVVTLIEPSRKKSAFLRYVIRTLRLPHVTVSQKRVEDLPRGTFDMAVTRALFSMGELVRKAGHVLRKEGFFILSKGPKVWEEIPGLPAHCRVEVRELCLRSADLRRNIVKVMC